MRQLPSLPTRHALTTAVTSLLSTGVIAGSMVFAGSASAQGADEKPTFLRVTETSSDVISLEIAVSTFQPKANEDGERAEGPLIRLVGVAHIADTDYYKQLETLLGEHDIVLYESVMPSGASGASGDNADERVASTKAAMAFVASLIEAYHEGNGSYPMSLNDVETDSLQHDVRYGRWMQRAMIDAWGNPLDYMLTADGRSYRLVSLGSDHAQGGEAEAADITTPGDLDIANMIMPMTGDGEDNLQKQLADAVGLDFQLESIDYGKDNFVCSDMTMDQLNRAFEDAGVDFQLFGSTLAGSSIPAKVIKALLGVVKMADSVMGGAVADMFKVILIEMLGDPAAMDMSMQQMGAAFGDVIVGARNQVVMDDLKNVMADASANHETIAVFYGAAHNGDFTDRFAEQIGYEMTEQEWLPAITVDLEESAVNPRQLAMLRMSIRRAMKQMR